MTPPELDLPVLRSIAERAARIGGELAAQRFGQPVAIRRKKDGSEVSEVDELAQALIVREIRAVRPADACIGEEILPETDLPPPTNDTLCWIIDPIDGTRNYVRGMSGYACAVAAVFRGEPVAAATFVPTWNTMYSASAGEPLLLNGAVLRTPLAEALGDRSPSLVVAVPSQSKPPIRERVHTWLDRFVGRNFGSSALHLALVATGQLQGCLLADCRIWDIAGGVLLVRSAGGAVVSFDGNPLTPFDVTRDIELARPCIAAGTPELLHTLLRT